MCSAISSALALSLSLSSFLSGESLQNEICEETGPAV